MNSQNTRVWCGAAAALLLGLAVGTFAAPLNSLFNPRDYPALAANLTVSAGAIVIDTKDGSTAPTMTIGTTNYTGQIVTNQSGNVVMALFCFGNVDIGGTASLSVTGNLGLVLASRTELAISRTIDLSGANGTTNGSGGTGPGGPGAEAGTLTNQFKSNPPNANHGKGGYGYQNGYGYGGSKYEGNPADIPPTGASGAGYGGGGGLRGGGAVNSGVPYGDSMLTDLYGGSGAGGATASGGGGRYGGAGGGGSLELAASQRLIMSGTLRVNGGNGATDYRATSGASGGGIILAGNKVLVSGTVEARGGNGGKGSDGPRMGGGAGGGRIAFYANALATNGMAVSVAGGTATADGTAGTNGTFRYRGDGQAGDLSYPFGCVPGTIIYFR